MKRIPFYLPIILLIASMVLTECTVKKRSYRKGYYVSWNKKKQKQPVEKRDQTFARTVSQEKGSSKHSEPLLSKNRPTLLVSAEKTIPQQLSQPALKALPQLSDSCGDLIVLRTGDEVYADVTEVNSTNIKYKRCDNKGGPTIVVSVQRVFMIRYANGSKEVFKKPAPVETLPHDQFIQTQHAVQNQSIKKKQNGFGIASFVISFFSWTFILAPVALILGIVGLSQIKREPGKYKSNAMAAFGVTISAIFLLLLLIALLSL